MTTFLLVRHGETDQVGRSLAGRMPGCHLNKTGQEQARRLAELLAPVSIRAIYTSPLERALETAEPIAASHGLVPKILEPLVELQFGQWQGRTFQDLEADSQWRRFNSTRSMVPACEGEFMIQAQARMVRAIAALREVHPGETIVIVSHGDPLRALVAHCLGIPLDLLLRFEISPASVTAVQFAGDLPLIKYLNYAGEAIR